MVGLFYAVMSLAALAAGVMYPQCLSDACLKLPGIFGRSWFLWGALFYAVSAVLYLNARRKRPVMAFLAGGAAFHVALMGYGYALHGSVCSLCWKFAALDIALPALYFYAPGLGPLAQKIKAPAWALPVIAAAFLAVNPAAVADGGPARKSNPPVAVAGILTENPETPATISVFTAQGQSAELDLKHKPVLFFAAWCPHCDEALRAVSALPEEKQPYLVATFIRKGDAEKIPAKLSQNGLAGQKYYLTDAPPELQMVPALMYQTGGNVELREGTEAIDEWINGGGDHNDN